ncbi:MAG: DUF937 domain-containing protein [Fodinibius sp.]|nr:DUF937 domain-containing protein [Fodinibius sp.]
MLDQIISTVSKNVSNRLTKEMGLSSKQAQKSISAAGESVSTVLQDEVAKGNTSALANLFSKEISELSDNSIFSKIETLFLSKLSSSLNITGAKASEIKDLVLPHLLKAIGKSTNVEESGNLASLKSLLKPEAGTSKLGSLGSQLGNFLKRK